MTKKQILLVLFFAINSTFVYSQSDTLEKNDYGNLVIIDSVETTNPIRTLGAYHYYITNSIGFTPSESEPSFSVSFSTTYNNKVYFGLKVGMYNSQKDLDMAVNEYLTSLGPLGAGTYVVQGTFATTQMPTYIGSLYGGYYLSGEFSLNAGFGFKYYKEQIYYGELTFGIPAYGYPPPVVTITPRNPFYVAKTNEVIRAYYSLGMDYNFGTYKIGVYGDNLYSFGINLGIGFN